MEKYEATWNSLKRHCQPEWLDDAKFGIYFHWGPYSVPAKFNEWYPHRMYKKGNPNNTYHIATYGKVSKFGYKDFIPLFTAENFNADEWAKLFKEAGAKFAGPVAEHHDGFSMWDSEVNPFCAAKMGPKRDIVGEMAEAVRKQGMKFICTFHHSHNWYYYNHRKDVDTSDPQYAKLYGPAHPKLRKDGTSDSKLDRPDGDFSEYWFAKLKEVIDKYQPDLIWFDFGLKRIHDKYKRKMAAYYYNKGLEWGKEVEIIYKGHDMPPGMGLLDYERGRSDKMTYQKWITDTTLGKLSWSYVKGEIYKPISSLIHNFADRIAKNGYLLLNFGPKANGEIPEPMVKRFKEMGEWIKVNQEAIYNTTPWVVAEEGPTKMRKSGGFSEVLEVKYGSKDLRFVVKDHALYVFTMGWPGKELTIKSLTAPPKQKGKMRLRRRLPQDMYLIENSDIKSIRMLGVDENLTWKITDTGLKIRTPSTKPCKHAFVLKISWNE